MSFTTNRVSFKCYFYVKRKYRNRNCPVMLNSSQSIWSDWVTDWLAGWLKKDKNSSSSSNNNRKQYKRNRFNGTLLFFSLLAIVTTTCVSGHNRSYKYEVWYCRLFSRLDWLWLRMERAVDGDGAWKRAKWKNESQWWWHTYERTYVCWYGWWVHVTYAHHCDFGGVANALPYNSFQCTHCTNTHTLTHMYGRTQILHKPHKRFIFRNIFYIRPKIPGYPKTIRKWTNEKIWHLEWVVYNEAITSKCHMHTLSSSIHCSK